MVNYGKKYSGIIAAVVVMLVCGFLIFKNYNQKSFFSASLTDIITILIGAFITIFITERLADQRRRNDCIEHIITEIENFVADDNNFTIAKNTFIKQASCANRIKYLKDADFLDIKEDIEFISTNFQNIRDLYSNHNQSSETLQTVKIDIDKHRNNIVDKCTKIRVSLYK